MNNYGVFITCQDCPGTRQLCK